MNGIATCRQVYLGGYELEEAAAEAYDMAALKCKGRGCPTNFPYERYADLLESLDSMTLEELIMAVRRQSQVCIETDIHNATVCLKCSSVRSRDCFSCLRKYLFNALQPFKQTSLHHNALLLALLPGQAGILILRCWRRRPPPVLVSSFDVKHAHTRIRITISPSLSAPASSNYVLFTACRASHGAPATTEA